MSWIKMRVELQSHPKVVRILSATDADKFRVIGGLHAVWSVFDQHSTDGALHGYTPELMDHIIGWQGFADAMIAVGWLGYDGEECLTIPEFTEHNGQSAKRRAEDQKRKRNARKRPHSVRNQSADDAEQERTRERERVRSNKTPHTPRKRGAKPAIGLKTFLENCKTNGEKPIPENDPVFDYAQEVGLSRDLLWLCWREFVDRNTDSGKRYADWRRTFRNAVRGNWYRLWFVDNESTVNLTSQGKLAQRKHKEAA